MSTFICKISLQYSLPFCKQKQIVPSSYFLYFRDNRSFSMSRSVSSQGLLESLGNYKKCNSSVILNRSSLPNLFSLFPCKQYIFFLKNLIISTIGYKVDKKKRHETVFLDYQRWPVLRPVSGQWTHPRGRRNWPQVGILSYSEKNIVI